jgi:outer membrane biogenesis lipoprotein LolB
VRLAQAGWDIRYDRYQVLDGVAWPGRLKLVRDDIAVRLVIDSWRPGLPATGPR